MSWTNFFIVIFVVYLVYFALNLIFDLFLSPKGNQQQIAEDELFFSQTYSPELITTDEATPQEPIMPETAKIEKPAAVISTGQIAFSGAVSLKHLFSLAKDNLIEHTRAIPY